MWQKHQHRSCIERALRNAEEVCLERKCRFTPIRRKVLGLVWGSHKPVKAYELLAQMGSEHSVEKPPTVYRALEFLIENNLIHRIESQNAYIGCNTHHDTSDSKFLICDRCHEVEELSEPEIHKALEQLSRRQGFTPNLMNVEIHGICAQCAQT